MQILPTQFAHTFSNMIHKMGTALLFFVCWAVVTAFLFTGCSRPVEAETPPDTDYVIHRPYQALNVNWEQIAQPAFVYPVGKPFYSAERRIYESESLILEVPRIGYSGAVLGGVDDHSLTLGIGLYDYSPLPGPLWYNANVSIAGHRDVYGCEFYYVDTITDGDELYLTYDNQRYTYVYDSTKIIEDDDWSVIFCTGYPTLTLTSCHPIGTSDYRIVVKARLVDITSL